MKTALAISLIVPLSLGLMAQSRTAAATNPPSQPDRPASAQPPVPALNSILADVQRTTQSTNVDLSRLRIEKWKVDGSEKEQMQQVATSLQKNITMAVPGLISDVQATPGSVLKAFKLYDDLNVVYEYLNSLAEAAGAYGKKEEYTPLANDASALDSARRNLSTYIEQAANTLEIKTRQVPVPQQVQPTPTPKKIVIDDEPAPKKAVKKKKPAAKPSPTPTPTPSQ